MVVLADGLGALALVFSHSRLQLLLAVTEQLSFSTEGGPLLELLRSRYMSFSRTTRSISFSISLISARRERHEPGP